MEKLKFVGYGRMIESKYSKGFAISLDITGLLDLCEKDPEVIKSICVSEFNGHKYLNLVAWPLREPTDKKMTHSIRVDTYQGYTSKANDNTTNNSALKFGNTKNTDNELSNTDNELPF